jgi:hypothetical protein
MQREERKKRQRDEEVNSTEAEELPLSEALLSND